MASRLCTARTPPTSTCEKGTETASYANELRRGHKPLPPGRLGPLDKPERSHLIRTRSHGATAPSIG